jgi:hypothetical protein
VSKTDQEGVREGGRANGQPGDLMTPEDQALRATSNGSCPCCGAPLYPGDADLCPWCLWYAERGGCSHVR